MNEHYFSAQPASDAQLRTIDVRLAGRELSVSTAAGVFSPGHLDTGTRVLLDEIPDPPDGDVLDLGCGWGPVAIHTALTGAAAGTHPRIWALDVNERALDLVRRNAADLGLGSIRAVTAADIPPQVRFAAIYSNPPIRVGKAVLHELLLTWLPRLAPGGAAWLVVAKKLGADSLLTWLRSELGEAYAVERTTTSKGFRILRIERLAD